MRHSENFLRSRKKKINRSFIFEDDERTNQHHRSKARGDLMLLLLRIYNIDRMNEYEAVRERTRFLGLNFESSFIILPFYCK